MILHNLVPYSEKKLDCYQNMLVTILANEGCDLNLLGAMLPWRYYRRGVSGEIANCYIASDSTVEEVYGYEVRRQIFQLGSIVENLIDALSNGPVIVNVDQFYIPHHYVHIYQKQHGQHSLLITGYNKQKNIFYCVDAFPQYTGEISCGVLETAIKNFPFEYVKMEYSTVAQIERVVKSTDEILKGFVKSSRAYREYEDKGVFSNRAILELFDEIATLSDLCFYEELNSVCSGTWIWEMDRTVHWTISYINTEYVRKVYGDENIKLLEKLLLQCNAICVGAYRLIYKSLVSKSRKNFWQGHDKLKEAILVQNEICKLIDA